MGSDLIIGAVPPPRGGVAVYLQRKVARLRASGHDVDWQNPRNIFSLICKLAILKVGRDKKNAEIHTAHVVALAIACLFRVEPLLSFYDHNYSSNFINRGLFSKFLLSIFLRRINKIIVVSEHLKKNYISLVPKIKLAAIEVEIPYIPLSDGSITFSSELAADVRCFVDKFKLVVVNAAWKLADDAFGKDLYGVRWSLESFLKYYGNSECIGFVIIVGSPEGGRYEEIVEIGNKFDNVLVLGGEHDLCSILTVADSILLRTTSTDGDSLSVREAVELDRPVIASDVVCRPSAAIVYKHGSRESFESIMISVINKRLSGLEIM